MMIFGGGTNQNDVSIDTVYSKEIIAGTHITEHLTFESQGPVPPELLSMTPNEPQAYDLSQNYQLDSLKFFEVSTILSKTDHVTNNVTNTPATNILSQENQDYYNPRDLQYIARKYKVGVEQVALELVPNIILEEKKKTVLSMG